MSTFGRIKTMPSGISPQQVWIVPEAVSAVNVALAANSEDGARLVACWNACMELPTERLAEESLANTLMCQAGEIAELRAQRDDMQARLSKAVGEKLDRAMALSSSQALAKANAAALGAALKERDELRLLLKNIYNDLPAKRDWLDPSLEQSMKKEAMNHDQQIPT